MADEPRTNATETPTPGTDSQAPAFTDTLDEHPEILVGAAFVGGFVLAQILKKVGE
jgi:hypothetical protein